MARPARKPDLFPKPSDFGVGEEAANRALCQHVIGRFSGLRVNRYSWWVHWRELADFMLPRRYKWLITPNQATRGSPINQHIIDSTATLAARNCASGIMSGMTNPSKPWFRLKVGHIDSTQTSPVSLWLKEVERLMMLVFQESNYYDSTATLLFDLVIFGTGVRILYENFKNVIHCFNPCAGEYFLDVDDNFVPCVLAREFVLTVQQVVDQFGYENCSVAVQGLYDSGQAQLTREVLIWHMIEPNDDGRKFGVPESFKYRECYLEAGQDHKLILSKRGFHECPFVAARWDLVSNDPYGRSPAMDALPDVKQLQLEVRRKAQAIDKMVNPPLIADIQLKNQPASLLPGGVTYIAGQLSSSRPGFAPVYEVQPRLNEMVQDLAEIRDRIRRTFFNDLFQTASQYETRSNVTAVEWDMRKSESLVMLGPVLGRIQNEMLSLDIERTFAIMSRAGILPPAPSEVRGANINIEYISILSQAQAAAATAGIERLFSIAGNLAGVDPAVMDNIDIDYALDKYSDLMNNDPRIIRSPAQLAAIRQARQQQQAQQQQAEMAEKLAAGAKTLSETNVGGGQNALERMAGAGGGPGLGA